MEELHIDQQQELLLDEAERVRVDFTGWESKKRSLVCPDCQGEAACMIDPVLEDEFSPEPMLMARIIGYRLRGTCTACNHFLESKIAYCAPYQPVNWQEALGQDKNKIPIPIPIPIPKPVVAPENTDSENEIVGKEEPLSENGQEKLTESEEQ